MKENLLATPLKPFGPRTNYSEPMGTHGRVFQAEINAIAGQNYSGNNGYQNTLESAARRKLT